MSTQGSAFGAFQALRSLSKPQVRREFCELCGVAVAPGHPHLFERSRNAILCACPSCSVLFSHRDHTRELVRIPRDAKRLNAFELSDAQWNALRLPIDLAFFVHNTASERTVAYYPSPAGSVESLLDLSAWEEIVQTNASLQKREPDVEALLVDRSRGNRRYWIAPIDECYKLTGIIRAKWRGLSGGDEVWREVDRFFDGLDVRCA